MPSELPHALLAEGNATDDAVGRALFLSLSDGVSVVQSLIASAAADRDLVERYLARSHAPARDSIEPRMDLVARLPRGLCARLLALPVDHDPETNAFSIAVADPTDPHPAKEMAFHLGGRVQVVRASVLALERALAAFDPPGSVRSAAPLRSEAVRAVASEPSAWVAAPSLIPGPPPASRPPRATTTAPLDRRIGGILTDLQNASSRDEVLELVIGGARMVAPRAALFVAKRAGYLGWACTPEFGARAALQAVLVSPDHCRIFELAVQSGFYLGPLPLEETPAPLLELLGGASGQVASLPIRVGGKPAAILLATELRDAVTSVRELTELAETAGGALMRVIQLSR